MAPASLPGGRAFLTEGPAFQMALVGLGSQPLSMDSNQVGGQEAPCRSSSQPELGPRGRQEGGCLPEFGSGETVPRGYEGGFPDAVGKHSSV